MKLGDVRAVPPSVANLPTTLDARGVADLLGVSTASVYDAARSHALPPGLEPIRIGRRMHWPTARVLDALGLLITDMPQSSAGAATQGPARKQRSCSAHAFSIVENSKR